MNIVRELRIKKGVQQKELAMELGISSAAISNWEHGKADPSGKNLKQLADYFGVDELFILGYGQENPNLFVPDNPKISGVSETDQVVQYILKRLGVPQNTNDPSPVPQTQEARILANGVDKLPKEQREMALNVVKAMFTQYADYFERTDADDT
jgi:transcriptional regulator with XRE-family HTH domain